jgi:hypothetical protein
MIISWRWTTRESEGRESGRKKASDEQSAFGVLFMAPACLLSLLSHGHVPMDNGPGASQPRQVHFVSGRLWPYLPIPIHLKPGESPVLCDLNANVPPFYLGLQLKVVFFHGRGRKKLVMAVLFFNLGWKGWSNTRASWECCGSPSKVKKRGIRDVSLHLC